MSQYAKVVKSGSLEQILEVDQFNYEDLRVRCENYLESIREQTRVMLTQAQQEVEQIKQKAKQQGLQEGIQQGLQEAEKQSNQKIKQKAEQLILKKMEAVVPLLQQATEELEHNRQACLARWEEQVMELVLAITEKIICKNLAVDPEIVQARLIDVLNLTVGNSQIVIRIAEQDMESLEEFQETVLAGLAQHAEIKLISDADFSPGDLFVTTEQGEVDARIEVQLERIAEELGVN